MLCRLILFAVALSCEIPVHAREPNQTRLVQIKDVICVLLLSGLQKNDLDANTLEKLQRYNVNIYNMSNDNLHKECLLKSYSDTNIENPMRSAYDATEERNDTTVTPLNQNYNNFEAGVLHNSEIILQTNYFTDETTSRNVADEDLNAIIIKKERNGSDKFKNINQIQNKDEIIAKLEKNTDVVAYAKNQSFLDNIIKVWQTISQKATTIATSRPSTSIYPTQRKPVLDSNTVKAQNSNDIECIKRIIVEYLINQTATPTTTEITTIQNKVTFIKKFKEFLEQEYRESKKLKDNSTTTNSQNLINRFEINEHIEDVNRRLEFLRLMPINKKNEYTSQAALKENDYSNNEELQMISYFSDHYGAAIKKQIKEKEALQHFDNIHEFNKQFNVNMQNPYIEKSVVGKENNDSNKPYVFIKNSSFDTRSKNNDNKNSIKFKYNKEVIDQVSVPADIIQTIAEKVKEIVIKDLRKETPEVSGSTLSKINFVTTTANRNATTVASTQDKNMTQHDQDEGARLQILMEIMRSFKTLNDNTTAKQNKFLHSNLKLLNPEAPSPQVFNPDITSFDSYNLKTSIVNIDQKDMNPHSHSLERIPLGLKHKALQQDQYNWQTSVYHNNKYKLSPMTIQTNSNEIPPLVIPISKPMKLIHQHIIVTTENPLDREKELKMKSKQLKDITEILDISEIEKRHNNNPIYDDLMKKLNIAAIINKEFIDSYKGRIEKLKDRMQCANQHNCKNERVIINQPPNFIQRIGVNRPVKPNHHDTGKLIDSSLETISRQMGPIYQKNYRNENYLQDSNYKESLSRPLNSNNRKPINRPLLNYKYLETQRDDNNPAILGGSPNWSPYRNFKQPVDTNYEAIKPARYSNILKNGAPLAGLKDLQYHQFISQVSQSQSSRDSNPHKEYPRLHEAMIQSKPFDYRVNHLLHDRNEQPNTVKFSEKLEKPENLGCCDVIASRHQKPLSKITQRTKFDNTHLRNFIKSQQKVNDMLEKILADKSKTDFQSVETL